MYEVIKLRDESAGYVIKMTAEDEIVYWIPMDEANSDYRQYLVDTDGGLPIPE